MQKMRRQHKLHSPVPRQLRERAGGDDDDEERLQTASDTTTSSRRRPTSRPSDDDPDDDNEKTTSSRRRRPPSSTVSTRARAPPSRNSTSNLAPLTSTSGPTIDAELQSIPSLDVAKGTIESYDAAIFATGSGASAIIAAESSQAASAANPGFTLTTPVLYGIIGGSVAFAMLLAAFIIALCCYKRRKAKRARETQDWCNTSQYRASEMTFGPGKGPGARGTRLADEQDSLELEKSGNFPLGSPFDDEKQAYPFPVTPIYTAAQNTNYVVEGDLAPSHPDYAPARPPRTDEQYHFERSPVKPIQHKAQPSLTAYQKNVLALTQSMSFDTTALDPAPTVPIPPLQPSGPNDSIRAREQTSDLQRKASKAKNSKKDTLIGFAESYGDADDEAEEALPPTLPLSIRSSTVSTKRDDVSSPLDAQELDQHPLPLSGLQRSFSKSSQKNAAPRTPDLPHTLSTLDTQLSSGTSMQDMLDSVAYDKKLAAAAAAIDESASSTVIPEIARPAPLVLGNRAPNRALGVPEGATSANRSGYKVTRPGATAPTAPVINHTLSIHSTAGSIGEMSPVRSIFGASITFPNLAAIAAPPQSSAALPRTVTTSALSQRRRSIVRDSRPAVIRSNSREPEGEVLLSASGRRASTTSGVEELASRPASPFVIGEDDEDEGKDYFAKRRQSVSTSAATPAAAFESAVAATTSRRQRTSTAYGGQMLESTSASAGWASARQRTQTTESQAFFALGSNMLAISSEDDPHHEQHKSPAIPSQYLLSSSASGPGLSIQPPSPSIGSEHTEFSVHKAEKDYQQSLAEQGFVPLSQMAIGFDRHYRSPIDSIVGSFEYDDPRLSSSLS